MKIDELCSYAQENGFDSVEFEFKSLFGPIVKCKWLDAYMKIFKIEGNEGFITVAHWKKATNDIFDFTIIEK